jgi:hypothetical protein
LCELSAERSRLDEVREGALAVDLDHRQPLAVLGLERLVVGDVDLIELEALVGLSGEYDPLRRLAQVAARSGIKDDAGYGYRPRVMVASATRWTARP